MSSEPYHEGDPKASWALDGCCIMLLIFLLGVIVGYFMGRADGWMIDRQSQEAQHENP